MKKNGKKSLEWKIRIPALRLRYRLLLYAATVLFVALSLINVGMRSLPYMAGIGSYVLAAGTLAASCYYLMLDIRYGVEEKLKPGIKAHPFTNRVSVDYRYRTVVFAVPGLLLNVIFAVFNGAIGLIGSSPWFGSLSAYYLLLSVMRFGAVRYDRRAAKGEQTAELMQDGISVYRRCGILFIIMTAALAGAVILLVHAKGGKHYPGFTIFAVAAYTFYKIIIAVINMIKAGKLRSPLLMAIRDIGYVDACVSVLTLQTAMFAAFGEGQEDLSKGMNGLTGSVVCLMVLAMGVRVIRICAKMKKELTETTGGNCNDSYTCGGG